MSGQAASAHGRVPLAVTQGEPAGIGTEIILKAWLQREARELHPFIVIGDPAEMTRQAGSLGLGVPVTECGPEYAATVFSDALPVLALEGHFKARPGNPHPDDGRLVADAIVRAVDLCMDGRASAMVTAPINKKALYDAGFRHPGHTEFLAALAEGRTGRAMPPVMMLAGPQLRAIPVTIHVPLGQVPGLLSGELIAQTIRIADHDLRQRFSIARPRIAVAGLNPHAGEGGSMGREEIDMITPVIGELKAEGIDVFGPLPADTMFHAAARSRYDVAVCMYHDQALIPAKTLGFDDTVNVTLGLPFIRTSPDHGTAFDIAGKGIANPESFIAALGLAAEMARSTAAGKNAS